MEWHPLKAPLLYANAGELAPRRGLLTAEAMQKATQYPENRTTSTDCYPESKSITSKSSAEMLIKQSFHVICRRLYGGDE